METFGLDLSGRHTLVQARLASPCLIPCNRSSWLQLLTSLRPAADDDVDFELVVDVICAAECWVSVGPRLPVSEGSTADPFHDVESTLPPVFISVSHPDHKQLIIFLSPNNSKSRRVFLLLIMPRNGHSLCVIHDIRQNFYTASYLKYIFHNVYCYGF